MIVLTGNKGYIGSHLDQAFPDAINLDESKDFRKWLSLLFDIERQLRIRGDKVHTIIHCGANADSLYDKPDIFQWNYEATCHLVNFARKYNAHLVFFSSCAAIEPCSFYGWSKRVAEEYVATNILEHTILRPYNVYGDEDHGRSERFSVPEKLNRRILQYVFHPFRRDYIHVQDVVRAVEHVVQHKNLGTFDLGTGKAVEVKAIAELTDPACYEVTTAQAVLGENCPPLELCARYNKMIPGFSTRHDVFEYMM